MASLNKDELIAYWNYYVQSWAKNPKDQFLNEENIFKYITYIPFDPLGVPEPYLGDPARCSAVILNYNPGPVMDEYQHHHGGKFITEARAHENYHEFAKDFPYLGVYSDNSGGKWWKQRNNWINRLTSHSTGENQEMLHSLRPFALEICPWHSGKFKLRTSDISMLAGYITKFVLGPAEEVAKNAILPFIISVGKDYHDLFQELSFRKEFEIRPDTFMQYGITYPTVNNRAVCRVYSVWRSESGCIYLNTYSQGSNSCPKAEFGEVEKFVLSKITYLLGETGPSSSPVTLNKIPLTPYEEHKVAPTFNGQAAISIMSDGPLTNSALRQGIIDSVAKAIAELNMTDYIETPKTSHRKINFDAHIKLTRLGKTKFNTIVANPSKQIMHPELGKLQINSDLIPVIFRNNIGFYKDFALSRLQEFLLELNINL